MEVRNVVVQNVNGELTKQCYWKIKIILSMNIMYFRCNMHVQIGEISQKEEEGEIRKAF